MALNEHFKGLISSVADNDLQKAKKYVQIIISSEKAASNQSFIQRIKTRLETASANLLELPHDIRPLLKMEDVTISFNEQRYFLTEREKAIFDKIKTANEVNLKLSEMGIKYLNSTLLYGESGTGKTTFGRYVAYKLGIPFAYLNFSHLIDSYLGGTGKNIAKVFDYVSKTRCVLMLDEVDAIGTRRGESNEMGEMTRIVLGLMQALDLLQNDVVVLAATNRYDILDDALKRRFTSAHEIKILQPEEVEKMIEMFLTDLQQDFNKEKVKDYSKIPRKQSEIMKDIIESIIEQLQNGGQIEFK